MTATRPIVGCLALFVGACAAPNEQHEVFAQILETSVTLPDATYGVPPQSAAFRLENTGADTLYVAPSAPEGEAGELLVVQLVPFTKLYPGQTMALEVTLDPRTWLWKTGTYNPKFRVQASYFFSGQAEDEPEVVSATDPPVVVAAEAEVVVRFTINCDRDDDGFDAVECGGDDCDDDEETTYPGAPEICDGRDQDCDAGRDEDATDQREWFTDDDGDGYGVSAPTLLACYAPDEYWSANSDDCDDANGLISPASAEICDGVDNDCDDRTDEGC
jgi:hypothetical protein